MQEPLPLAPEKQDAFPHKQGEEQLGPYSSGQLAAAQKVTDAKSLSPAQDWELILKHNGLAARYLQEKGRQEAHQSKLDQKNHPKKDDIREHSLTERSKM